MLQAADINEDQLQMLKLSGLIQQGQLAETATLSECDISIFLFYQCCW